MKTKISIKIAIVFVFIILFFCSCSVRKNTPDLVNNKRASNVEASYYHKKFNGKKTASGEIFHNSRKTAAHKTLPFGTIVKVTNKKNNKSVKVKINDRGPFTKGREIDLSKKAFMKITDDNKKGVLKVDIKVVKRVK